MNLNRSLSCESGKRTISGRASSIDMKEKVRSDEAISLSRAHCVWKKRREDGHQKIKLDQGENETGKCCEHELYF